MLSSTKPWSAFPRLRPPTRRGLRVFGTFLTVVLLANSLVFLQWAAYSSEGHPRRAPRRAGKSAGEESKAPSACEKLRADVSQRADRQLIRNGALLSCSECKRVLASKEDPSLHSCSKCELLPPPAVNLSIIDDASLPDAGDLAWRRREAELGDWFVHRENAQRLGREALPTEGLPADAQEALQGFQVGKVWGRCAVVASGGCLWRSSLGREIDGHDVVMRINQAPVVGYEKHVGSKTHIRLLNNRWTFKYSKDSRSPNSAKNSASMPLEEGVTALLTRSDDEDYARFMADIHPARLDVAVRLLSSRVVSATRDTLLQPYRARLNATCHEPLLRAVVEGRDTPSSGLVGVFIMMHLCEHVTVYGFSGNNDSKHYHYFKSNRNYMNRAHSMSAERALLRALAAARLLHFAQGNTDYVLSGVR